jgi:hypothetical protein
MPQLTTRPNFYLEPTVFRSGARSKIQAMATQLGSGGETKVFCFFSSEKKTLPSLWIALLSRAPGEQL